MSKSRANQRRAKRRSNNTHPVEQAVSVSMAEFEQMLTDADLRLLDEAARAEQCGDLRRALTCLQRTPRPIGNPWEHDLTEMIDLGPEAEPWQWARFTIAAASRWVRSLHVPLVARILREVGIAAEGAQGPAYPEYPGWVAGQSALHTAIGGTLLFDELLLEVFLVQVAPVLAERCGRGRTWAQTRAKVYELIDVQGIELQVRDHADRTMRTVRHLGEVVGLSRNDLVYGHIIDVPGEPGSVFAMAPIVVDEIVAQRLERMHAQDPCDLEARCEVLGAAVRSRQPNQRLEPVVDDEPADRVRDLMAEGLCRDDAEQLACVEATVMTCEIAPDSAAVGAFHAGDALANPTVLAEAMHRLTEPEHEPVWRALAEACHGRQRTRFVQLAEASRAFEDAS